MITFVQIFYTEFDENLIRVSAVNVMSPIDRQAEGREQRIHIRLSSFTLQTLYRILSQTIAKYLNEVIPLCINSIYLLYYTIPSTQHKNQSYRNGHNQDHENNGPKKQHTRLPQYTRRYNST